jgi:hypothetical protein
MAIMRWLIAIMVAGLLIAGLALFSWWNQDAVARSFAKNRRDFQNNEHALTIHVIDWDTGNAIPEFRYRFWMHTAGTPKPFEDHDWRLHKSATEPLVLQAAISCQLQFEVKARGYQGGQYRSHHTFDLKTTDKDRKQVVKLERGIRVKGTVRDAQTRMPVSGARVMPYQPVWPGYRQPDDEHAVLTDQSGTFTVLGVVPHLGVFVSHRDYLDGTIETKTEADERPNKITESKDVFLEEGRVVEGKVTAPDGQPLENVEVSHGLRRRILTAKNGAFLMRGLHLIGRESITFKKKGFITRSLDVVDKPPPQHIVMQPLYRLRGRVVDSQGKPVRRCLVMAGPGPNPAAYECSEVRMDNGSNDFMLDLAAEGRHWVGVRALGHAAWEDWAQVARHMGPLTIRLTVGATVTGTVVLPPGSVRQLEAQLTPVRL